MSAKPKPPPKKKAGGAPSGGPPKALRRASGGKGMKSGGGMVGVKPPPPGQRRHLGVSLDEVHMEKLVAGGNEDSSSDSEFGQWLALHMFHQPEIALACDKLGVMKLDDFKNLEMKDLEGAGCKPILARKLVALAHCELGDMHYNGRGVEKDLDLARDLFEKAASEGHISACFNLGVMCLHGEGLPGVNHARARELFEQASRAGDPGAQNNLGGMCYDGEGGPVDHERARELFEKASSRGDPQAQNNLGGMYYDGEGVATDHVRARDLFEKAAAEGHLLAQYNLAVMTLNGEGGIPVNHQAARNLLESAAGGGIGEAQTALGHLNELVPPSENGGAAAQAEDDYNISL